MPPRAPYQSQPKIPSLNNAAASILLKKYSHNTFFPVLVEPTTVVTEDPKVGAWLDWVKQEHPEHYETALAVSWPMPWTRSYGSDGEDVQSQILAARKRILEPVISGSSWRGYPSPLPKELHQTTFITDVALDFMQRQIQKKASQPFFSFVSYVDPHDPYDPPAPYDQMFSPEDMPEPILPVEDPLPVQVLEDSRDFNGFRSIGTDVKELKELRALYHGSIRFIDDQIGRLVEFLERNDLLENTIIVFTTDHGDMMGDHGLITKGVKHYDAGIRCPLIVSGSGMDSRVVEWLVCSLDFFPTLCDWAKIDVRPPLEGESFALDCEGLKHVSDRQAVVVQAQAEPSGGHAAGLITEDGWCLPNTTIPLRPRCSTSTKTQKKGKTFTVVRNIPGNVRNAETHRGV